MLILFISLFLPTLNLATGLERRSVSPSLPHAKRGIIDAARNVPQGYKFHQQQPTVSSVRALQSPKLLSYRNVKILPQESSLIVSGNPSNVYSDAFRHSSPYAGSQSAEQLSVYPENLFTISAAYKVGGDSNAKLSKQTGANGQVPAYKTGYSLPKASESQIYAPTFQTGKTVLPNFQAQRTPEYPAHFSSFESHPLVSNPQGYRFNFPARSPNPNNVQTSAPFLAPHSSFQGQVVAIPTATNSPQFPRYKGAIVEVHPTLGAFSPAVYQSLQAQPQLHFRHPNVHHEQRADEPRHSTPLQQIRSDVEIINKKKPPLPPKKDDGDDGDDDGDDDDNNDDDKGYDTSEKQYEVNSDIDSDYKVNPGNYFKASSTESNFKPSTSFPFKHYDETFGKHSHQNRDDEAREKAFAKYRGYSSTSSDDKDEEDAPSEKYRAEDTLPKSYYGKQKDDEEEDDDGEGGYERRRTEESSDDGRKSRYFDKDFHEEFEDAHRAELPKQRYHREKEASSRGTKDDYDNDDPASQRSRSSSGYRKIAQDFEDAEGHGSEILTSLGPETIHEESFGYKIPRKKF